MRRTLSILLVVFGTVVVVGGEPEEEEIQFCVDGDGNITLQDDPCPDLPVIPRSAAKATPPPAPAKPRPRAQPRRAVAPSWIRLPAAAAPPRGRSLGKQTFPTRLETDAPAAGPGFDSPARTWRTFLRAIAGNDPDAAWACLTPAARGRFGADAASLRLQEWREMLAGFTRIESDGDLGPYWSIHGERSGRPPKWIYFERTDDGEWKIAGI